MSPVDDRVPVDRRVTRSDVARAAGVSTAVVSYVVNGGPRPVATATAARVRAAIERLGYQPNSTARALRLGRTSTLALILPGTTNPFFADFALQIERAAAARGLALIMANSSGDAALEARLAADLAARQVEGLIVFGSPGSFPRPDLPTAFLDADEPVAGVATIATDMERGAYLAVDHLVQVHGHDSVGLLVGHSPGHRIEPREAGWRRALRDSGARPGPVVRAPFSRDGGYAAGLELLRDPPGALFVSSDHQAIGVLRAAHELGVDVPGRLAVVSFDGTAEAEYCWPPLTSVRQQVDAMAEAAVAAVLEPGRAAPEHRVYDVELVVRRSCGCGSPEDLLV